MQQGNTGRPKKKHFSSLSAKNAKNTKIMWLLGGVLVILIILAVCNVFSGHGDFGIQSKAYKKVSGTAGLHTAIQYDCRSDCQHKFDFNVYIMNTQGQQISVVRPDKDGIVQAALPEGDYILLIGKRLNKDKTFPEVPVELKSGQQLELKLQYGGVL